MSTPQLNPMKDPRMYVLAWLSLNNVTVNERGELKDSLNRLNTDIFDTMWLDYVKQVREHNAREMNKATNLRDKIHVVAEKDMAKALSELISKEKATHRKKTIETLRCDKEDLSHISTFVEAVYGEADPTHIGVLSHWMWMIKNKMQNKDVSYHIMPILYGKQGGGKCLKEGTLVKTPTGSVAIEDLKPGDKVYGYNKDGSVSLTTVTKLWNQGIKEVSDLTSHGIVIASCTDEHKWVTQSSRGIERVKKTGDFLKLEKLSKKTVKIPGGSKEVPEAYAIGALLGDGCCTCSGVVLSSTEENIVSKVTRSLGLKTYKKSKGKNHSWQIHTGNEGVRYKNEYYSKWCDNKKAHEKYTDLVEIRTWDRKSQLELLAGIIDTDGSIYVKDNKAVFCLSIQAKSVVETVQALLLDLFDVQSVIKEDNRDKYKNGTCYYIKFGGNRIIRAIQDELPLVSCKKSIEIPKQERFKKSSFLGIRKGKKYKAQCWDITVDNETHLFLLANGTVTHNTVALNKLIEPLQNYRLNIKMNQMTDDRYFFSMAENYVVVFDEMQGASRTDIDSLKNQITNDWNDARRLGTNDVFKVRQACSFIGATNKPVSEQVIDPTGMRRFWEVKTLEKLDWELLESIDFNKMWQGIDESRKDGYITEHIEKVAKAQNEMVLEDDFDCFMDDLNLKAAESDDDDAVAIPVKTIFNMYKSWAMDNGHRIYNKAWFGRKLKNKGIEQRQKKVNGLNQRCYFFHSDCAVNHHNTDLSLIGRTGGYREH